MRLAVGLVHYPILDREKRIVATNITNFDIHDIARACTVYGVEKYYLIHPAQEQLMFVDRVLEHWRVGVGSRYNPYRKTSLDPVTPVQSLEAAVKDWGVTNAIKIGTHARPVAGIKEWKSQELKNYLQSEIAEPKNACFLLFGTGFGMTTEFMQGLDGVLESIKGAPPNDYRHLSVRSAVSIYLDRVVGPC